jgi:hypothetical protein
MTEQERQDVKSVINYARGAAGSWNALLFLCALVFTDTISLDAIYAILLAVALLSWLWISRCEKDVRRRLRLDADD